MYVCMFVHFTCTGLEIGESLLPTDLQYSWVTANNQFRPIANHFVMNSQEDLFLSFSPFFNEVLCNKKQQCKQIANHCSSI